MARVMLIDGDQSNLEFKRQLPRMEGHESMWEGARAMDLRHGATEVMAKPFDLAPLRSAIRRCLGQVRP